MALSQKQKEDLLKVAGIALGAVAAWKILFSKKKVSTVAAEVVETPADVVKKAANITKKAAKTVSDGMAYPKGAKKGSPEMKAWMKYLRERRKK